MIVRLFKWVELAIARLLSSESMWARHLFEIEGGLRVVLHNKGIEYCHKN
jgi:hypothetical protein